MSEKHLEKATFAAGCFWGVEAAFRNLKGIVSTTVGYSGGNPLTGGQDPTYENVCSGKTGHAESVLVEYDPSQTTYEELLNVFWEIHPPHNEVMWGVHDPTTSNRQGPDVGSQYRSVIFFHDSEQKTLAKKSKAKLERSKKYQDPIVTEILPASIFYPAEEYHQQYLEKQGRSTCRI